MRPLLAEHCYGCHSAKAKKVKAGLLVDSREGLLKGGESGPAVVAGKPEQSRLIEAVRYSSPDLQMPPRGRLSDEQVADLVRWVELGAPWSGGSAAGGRRRRAASDMGQRRATHWAWQPVRASAPPAVEDEGWVRTRVDPFILARLEAAGLQPAPPADRRSLLRRIHFALIGLPPTPEEVEDFRRGPVARCPGAGGRPAAGFAALRRAMGPALDGPRPLQRHARQRSRHADPQRLAVSRLPRPRLQRRPALRPAHPRTPRRRPARRSSATSAMGATTSRSSAPPSSG